MTHYKIITIRDEDGYSHVIENGGSALSVHRKKGYKNSESDRNSRYMKINQHELDKDSALTRITIEFESTH